MFFSQLCLSPVQTRGTQVADFNQVWSLSGEVDKEEARELYKLKENDYNVGSHYLIWLRKNVQI